MSVPAVKNHGISYTPEFEDYCPHRALAASVILRAVLDYCEAKGTENNFSEVWRRAEKERNYRIRDQQRTRERRIARGVDPYEMKEIESTESIADKWIKQAEANKKEALRFLTGKTESAVWFQQCGMPFFTQKKLHWCYELHQNKRLSFEAIKELTRAKETGNDTEKQGTVSTTSGFSSQPREGRSPEARKEHLPEMRSQGVLG